MLIRTGFPSNKYSRDTTECETDLESAINTEQIMYFVLTIEYSEFLIIYVCFGGVSLQ